VDSDQIHPINPPEAVDRAAKQITTTDAVLLVNNDQITTNAIALVVLVLTTNERGNVAVVIDSDDQTRHLH